jgi:hypothetical protein
VKLGLEDKKKTMWAAALGVIALLAAAYEFVPMFIDSSEPSTSAQAAAPTTRVSTRNGARVSKKPRVENLDPTLRLDLLTPVEQTQYKGSGRNIFVTQAEAIPIPLGPGHTDTKVAEAQHIWTPPAPPQPQQIPLKFYGFSMKPGQPRRAFLEVGDDVFVAGEGEIVDRRYKVIHISPTSVEIQDMVSSGPPQNIPLTPG